MAGSFSLDEAVVLLERTYPSAGDMTVRNSRSYWLMVFVVGLRAFHLTSDYGPRSGGIVPQECSASI